jgi:GNAT superfamily N-acetyltransferase
MTPLTITRMTHAQLHKHLSWAVAEGWNPGLNDAAAFHAQDPLGFFLAKVDAEPVGMISGVRYGHDLGFIGLYIVSPKWRGQGHGMKLWDTALRHLRGRTMGLDGVVQRQADYARSGFVLAWRNVRYQGMTPATPHVHDPSVQALSAWPRGQILRLDQQHFGHPRPAFINSWLSQPGVIAVGHGTPRQLDAMAVMRPCSVGFKIGPCHAPNRHVARALMVSLMADLLPHTQIQIDIPQDHVQAQGLLQELGMNPVFETARMYRGHPKSIPLNQCYGITSFELG